MFYLLCAPNFSACSSNYLRLSSLEFQPLLHHGRTMATVLLEPLFAPAAATSAASHHRSRHHPSFHKPPLIQPHWHLWSTHSRSSHTPDSPHTPVYATTTTATSDSTIKTRVPAPAASTTAYCSSSHSTRFVVQTQPTARSSRWLRLCTSSTTPHPFTQATTPRLLASN